MKHRTFSFVNITFLLLLTINVFSQNNSSAFQDKTKLVVNLNRPRIFDNADKKKETAPTTFDLEKRVFDLINQQRRASGLSDLQWNDDVAKIARLHSQNMATYKFFSHRGLDGSMVNDRADALKVSKWQSIGENIAYNRGYANPLEFAVECWMESAGHRSNILNRGWKESGIGIAVAADGSYYFTQVFMLK